ncbi:CdaR family protein [Croceitalea rosinachiae]|uniref:YbbR-like domain-containing protein n=1 Tax=Croceitalea rosinachiae TaxID=3075596 RepID=A0ABU3AAT9_9FLAO|nr:YbbR-like domain-containing protein [Croceitalea sp. F388]MDT0607279.1 YbbR-like domain-containing protein [Croceitalea sp. F388]
MFLLFLLSSFLAWSISKLSESYESRADFEITFFNFPDSLLLNTTEKRFIKTKLRASGFKFFSYGISPKKLKLDLSNVTLREGRYYLASNTMKPQFEKQLSNNVSIIELEEDRLYVDLYEVVQKEVPVEANISLELSQNHLLDGELNIDPKSVILKGPSREVENITKIKTKQLTFNNLSEDFSDKVELVKPNELINSQISINTVVVSGKVVRFSEKKYTVSIKSINLPEEYRIRMFPNKVSLVCKAGVDVLKNIKDNDFEVIVDCANIDQSNNKLPLQLSRTPQKIYAVQLLKDQIEFVLEKI